MTSLSYIADEITLYFGYFLLFIGITGNGMNIIIFLSVRTYRTTPCTFYFLICSILNLAYISITLMTRIMSIGYGIDFTHTSIVWCKLRQFFVVSLSLISVTCSCLATIDQFLVTSKNANLRRYSNMKLTYRITLISIIIWCLHAIPVLVFRDIIPTNNTCVNTNAIYAIYIPLYLIGLFCGIPVLIVVIFGYLTYQNICQTRALVDQHADRQITKMTSIQVLFIIIFMVPFGIYTTYSSITSNVSKSADRLLKEYFASVIILTLTSFYFAGSCYMFIISSRRFRQAVLARILWCKRTHQVNPLHLITIGRVILPYNT